MNNVKVWKVIIFISVLTLKTLTFIPDIPSTSEISYYYNFIPGMFPRERSLRRYTLVTGTCFRGKTNFSTRTMFVVNPQTIVTFFCKRQNVSFQMQE